MRVFTNSFVVNCNIDKAWGFYTDVKHLKLITPFEVDLQIIDTTSQNISKGQEIWLSGKIIAKRRSRWHSRITSFKPYEYIDEMLEGPFKKWKHKHIFYENERKQTKILDEIEIELPYGIFGRLFEGYASKNLQKIFDHRRKATIAALEKNDF
ncbi:MAG TPA: SRPBCC family protein [Nitrososphaeraceae archaeon]|jgi:ligand-binding SRPBCC domain-containing protein